VAEELLRYHTIGGAGLPRPATADVVGDTEIRAGEGVVVSIVAANRDATGFADPDTVAVTRLLPSPALAVDVAELSA
jgi:cytochrome P450